MRQPKTATEFVLRGLLLPLSRENLLLSFKPSRFFYELSRISPHSEQTLRASYYRATKAGIIDISSAEPRLTQKGLRLAAPFQTTKISSAGQLLVIFDIPEIRSADRRIFRLFLKRLGFQQVQLSVWVSEYDHRDVVLAMITELRLEPYVLFYEAARLTMKK